MRKISVESVTESLTSEVDSKVQNSLRKIEFSSAIDGHSKHTTTPSSSKGNRRSKKLWT